MRNPRCTMAVILSLIALVVPRAAKAGSCTPGTVATVILQGPCTIGDKTFDFSNTYGGEFFDAASNMTTPITPDQLSFTPLPSASSPGFQIDSLLAANSSPADLHQFANFFEDFTVTPPSGQMITSTQAVLNGAVVTSSDSNNSFADTLLCPSGVTCAFDSFSAFGTTTATESSVTGGPLATFDGDFIIHNESLVEVAGGTGTGSASFLNAQFNFNESPSTVPEPSSLVLFGTGLIGTMGVMRRKLLQK